MADPPQSIESQSHKRKRSRSPPASPSERKLPRSRSRSPPRQRKRPGAASRIDANTKESLIARQRLREAEQLALTQKAVLERGSHDVVKQHYNAVPQRGREWRRTDSMIKGLRTFNNWIKSVLIQKFSPNEGYVAPPPRGGGGYHHRNGPPPPPPTQGNTLRVLDIGCGKGGDLGKWQKAPQPVGVYVGIDPAEVSIDQARERYVDSAKRARGRIFEGHFFAKDGYGEWIGEIAIVREIGIDGNVGPGSGGASSRWGNAGFDVVTMMFCMHYSFETEAKARGMLRNVAGALKKGGKFIGVIPNSDIIRENVEAFHRSKAVRVEKEILDGDEGNSDLKPSNTATTADGMPEDDPNTKGHAPEDGESSEESVPSWGNSIYRVRFPGSTPSDGIFRPPFGWKYSYFMTEAVEEVPEYVVPWEAFRALAEDYNLEQQYRKPFHEVWEEEKRDEVLGPLAERMGVTERGGRGQGERGSVLSAEEWEAVGFYHAFCFYKV